MVFKRFKRLVASPRRRFGTPGQCPRHPGCPTGPRESSPHSRRSLGTTQPLFWANSEILLNLRKIKRKQFIDSNISKQINAHENFIYYPLQLEPERTLLIPAGHYTNQIEVITNIARSIPIHFQLIVSFGAFYRLQQNHSCQLIN